MQPDPVCLEDTRGWLVKAEKDLSGGPGRWFKCNLLGSLRDVVPLIRLFGWGREADKSIAALALPASAWTGFARMKNARHPKDCATFGESSAAGRIFSVFGF